MGVTELAALEGRTQIARDVLSHAEGELSRALPPVAVVCGVVTVSGALVQAALGSSGTFRGWAAVGHLLLLATGLRWLRRRPRNAHLGALGVCVYLAMMIGTFVAQSGSTLSLINLALISLGASYFLVDWRYWIGVQGAVLLWFLFGAAATMRTPIFPSVAVASGLVAAGGVALRVGHIRVLQELCETRLALAREAAQRQLAQERAHASEKLESAALMAGGIAHDFNNLLVGVVGGADLAEESRDDPEAFAFALQAIREGAAGAAALCSKMLDISGGRFEPHVPVEVNEAVAKGVHSARASLAPSAQVETFLAATPLMVRGDPKQLQQIVHNLVVNASEAIGESAGVVRVRTRLDETGGAPCVVICVEDQGPGIPEAIRHRIFDPFFSTKFTGRGLGLAVVAGAVRTHRGEIEVHSSDAGSLFEVRIPAVREAMPLDADPRGRSLERRGSGTILLVDDEASVREVGRRLLASLGFDVIDARSGEAAIALLRSRGPEIRAAIVDATMPGLDGASTVRELRKMAPELPIWISSGYSAGSDELQRAAGIPLLAKPYGRSELGVALRELFDAE